MKRIQRQNKKGVKASASAPVKVVLLSDYLEKVNSEIRKRAMNEYLSGPVHKIYLLADLFADRIEQTVSDLRRNVVTPHLHVCCCAGNFSDILVKSSPYAIYDQYSPPEDTDEEIEEHSGRCWIRPEFAPPADLTTEKLVDYLVREEQCERMVCRSQYVADAKARGRYLTAVRSYLSEAAVIAKSVGSQSVRKFLEALRLLSDDGFGANDIVYDTDGSEGNSDKPCFRAEDADRAYALIGEAHGELWVDVRLAAVKTRSLKNLKAI